MTMTSSGAPARTRGYRRTGGWRQLLSFEHAIALLGLAIAALVAYPILRVVTGLVWVDGRLTLGGITQFLQLSDLGKMFLDTAIIVVLVTACSLTVGGGLAWLNERTDARMGVLTDVIPLVTFLIPSVAAATGWLLLLSPTSGYLNFGIRQLLSLIGVDRASGPFVAQSWPVVIFVYSLHVIPFAFLVLSAGLRQADSSQEEQSRMCGVGVLRTVRTVTIPSLRPFLWSALFLCVWSSLAAFSIPLILAHPAGIDVISVRIVRLLRLEYPPQIGAGVGIGIVTMVVLGTIWFLQQRVLRNQRFTVVGGKHSTISRIRLGRWRGLARAAMLFYLLLAVVLPVCAMTLTVLSGYWTVHINWSGLNLSTLSEVITGRRTAPALRNSLNLAAITATITVLATASLGWWGRQRRSLLRTGVGAVTKVPAAVSSIVIGVGFILGFAGYPFYLGGTLMVLLLAYIVVSMPEGSILAESAVGRVGNDLAEASRISGARSVRTFLSVYFPLMLPGIAAAWALVFVRIVGDLEISIMLASSSNPVIGFQILDLFENGGYAEMAALALIVTTLSTFVLTVMVYGSGRWSRRGGRG